MTRRGSQTRQPLSASGYRLYRRVNRNEVILQDVDDPKKLELWFKNDHSASYVIVIGGKGYEFVRSLSRGTASNKGRRYSRRRRGAYNKPPGIRKIEETLQHMNSIYGKGRLFNIKLNRKTGRGSVKQAIEVSQGRYSRRPRALSFRYKKGRVTFKGHARAV